MGHEFVEGGRAEKHVEKGDVADFIGLADAGEIKLHLAVDLLLDFLALLLFLRNLLVVFGDELVIQGNFIAQVVDLALQIVFLLQLGLSAGG